MTCLTSSSQQHVFMIKVIVLNFSTAFPSGTLSNNFHLLSNHSNNCRIKKLPWEIIGKTLSDTNRTNVFLGQTPKAIETKTKINKWDLIKVTSLCIGKETINRKTTYKMWEDICQQCNKRGLNFQNIQTAHTTQQQKKQTTRSKNGQRT